MGGALGGPTLICMCLVGPLWCFLFRRMERTTFGKQTFTYLATFAIWSKSVPGFGKCKSYNAKHGWGWVVGMDYMDKALAQKISTKWCVCVYTSVYMIVDVGCQRQTQWSWHIISFVKDSWLDLVNKRTQWSFVSDISFVKDSWLDLVNKRMDRIVMSDINLLRIVGLILWIRGWTQ